MDLRALTFHQLDFGVLVFAGPSAGYVMAVVGLWVGRLPGFIAIDIADYGRRYLVSDRPSAWVLGLAAHLVNSVLLAYAWASIIEPNLHWWRPLEGLAWGTVLAITLAGGLVAPMTTGVAGPVTATFSEVVREVTPANVLVWEPGTGTYPEAALTCQEVDEREQHGSPSHRGERMLPAATRPANRGF